MNTNKYETVIILTPVLSEQQMKDAVAGYRELITGNGGKLVHEENWGLTKLAYPIQKKGTGFYHLFEFTANPEFIKSFELAFRRDERVLRYLTVKLDRWGVDFNQRKRNGELRTVTPQGEKVVVKKKVVVEEEELLAKKQTSSSTKPLRFCKRRNTVASKSMVFATSITKTLSFC